MLKNCDNSEYIMKNAKYEVEVKAGESKTFCMCGKSKNQPFCDGSHIQACPTMPKLIKFEESGTVYVCGCGKTKDAPLCDGSCIIEAE